MCFFSVYQAWGMWDWGLPGPAPSLTERPRFLLPHVILSAALTSPWGIKPHCYTPRIKPGLSSQRRGPGPSWATQWPHEADHHPLPPPSLFSTRRHPRRRTWPLHQEHPAPRSRAHTPCPGASELFPSLTFSRLQIRQRLFFHCIQTHKKLVKTTRTLCLHSQKMTTRLHCRLFGSNGLRIKTNATT